jgi:hypothetical protein
VVVGYCAVLAEQELPNEDKALRAYYHAKKSFDLSLDACIIGELSSSRDSKKKRADLRENAWKHFGEAVSSGLLPGGIEQHATAHLEKLQQLRELGEAIAGTVPGTPGGEPEIPRQANKQSIPREKPHTNTRASWSLGWPCGLLVYSILGGRCWARVVSLLILDGDQRLLLTVNIIGAAVLLLTCSLSI